jgi:hypothetical protein
MPLKTRGREDVGTDSAIVLIDSNFQFWDDAGKMSPLFRKIPKKRLLLL